MAKKVKQKIQLVEGVDPRLVRTEVFMKSPELETPRISKYEIKNIILGDGQKLLRSERRFDAYLVSHPELFE